MKNITNQAASETGDTVVGTETKAAQRPVGRETSSSTMDDDDDAGGALAAAPVVMTTATTTTTKKNDTHTDGSSATTLEEGVNCAKKDISFICEEEQAVVLLSAHDEDRAAEQRVPGLIHLDGGGGRNERENHGDVGDDHDASTGLVVREQEEEDQKLRLTTAVDTRTRVHTNDDEGSMISTPNDSGSCDGDGDDDEGTVYVYEDEDDDCPQDESESESEHDGPQYRSGHEQVVVVLDADNNNDDELVVLRALVQRLQRTVTRLTDDLGRKDELLEVKARTIRRNNLQLMKDEVDLQAFAVMMHHYDTQVNQIPGLRDQLAAAREELTAARAETERLRDELRHGRHPNRLPRMPWDDDWGRDALGGRRPWDAEDWIRRPMAAPQRREHVPRNEGVVLLDAAAAADDDSAAAPANDAPPPPPPPPPLPPVIPPPQGLPHRTWQWLDRLRASCFGRRQ